MANIRNETPVSKIEIVNLWAIDHERLKIDNILFYNHKETLVKNVITDYLFDFLIVDLINTFSLFVEVIKNIFRFWNDISVELHNKASPAQSINNHGEVDHEVVEVAAGEDLWELQSFHHVILQIQLDIKFEGLHVVPEDLVHIVYVMIKQCEHSLLRSKSLNNRSILKMHEL